MSRRPPLRSLPRRFLVFALILVTAIAINVIQFRSIDQNTADHFAAIYRYDTNDIPAIGYERSRPFRDMYSPYLALGSVAPDSTVLVVRGSRLTRHEFVSRLYSYGQTSAVERVSSPLLHELVGTPDAEDETAPDAGAAGGAEAGFDPTPFVIARGDGGDRGPPWALAVADPPTGLPAPEELLPGTLRDGLPAAIAPEPRQFVMIEWHEPVAGAEFDFQDLLIEVTLLPANVQAELTS